ncbi:hypothetical protein [Nostocoides vanveenii]|jgi:nitrite reductase (NO-forming)|uniref:Copper oxidase n=1 Tax=Nostocoides vanveenii TaxID=330835 RepID=A0ABN2K7U1_9MICO
MTVLETKPVEPATPTRSVWPWRDHPSFLWLLVAGIVVAIRPLVPHADWLLIHLVLLGALTHAAIVWSTHFTQALLKTGPTIDVRRTQSRRLELLFAGVALVLTGVVAERWVLTVTGAILVSGAVVWHAVMLWRRLRASIAVRFRTTVHYYLAAATCVPLGATFGALLARGPDDDLRGRLLVAHTMVMVLGWLGLTVTGTLVTLWPTMLRTRMDPRDERLARQGLPILIGAVMVIVAGALTGVQLLAAAGLLLYLAGGAWWGRALWLPLRQATDRVRPALRGGRPDLGAQRDWVDRGKPCPAG